MWLVKFESESDPLPTMRSLFCIITSVMTSLLKKLKEKYKGRADEMQRLFVTLSDQTIFVSSNKDI